MKAERQHKEATSRVIQPSKGRGVCIVDNRPKSYSQTVLNDVAQLKTALIFYDQRHISGGTNLGGIAHSRVDMTYGQKSEALRPQGYVPGSGETCNHSVSYKMVRDRVDGILAGGTLNEGLNGLELLDFARNYSWEDGYEEENINNLIDNRIAELANDPRNLFYWPGHLGDSNGDAIDYPTFSDDLAYDYGKTMIVLEDYRAKLENILRKGGT